MCIRWLINFSDKQMLLGNLMSNFISLSSLEYVQKQTTERTIDISPRMYMTAAVKNEGYLKKKN